MSNPISEDCSSGLHDYCTPCECKCHNLDLWYEIEAWLKRDDPKFTILTKELGHITLTKEKK